MVRVSYTALGVALHFPASRGRRVSARLAVFGLLLLLPSLYAAFAYAPGTNANAAALLALALSAAVVYPVLLFGIVFLLAAFYVAAASLSVNISPTEIRAIRRLLGIRYSEQGLPTKSVARFASRPYSMPAGLGGGTSYRISAVDGAGTELMTLADRVPDEILCNELIAMIERYASPSRSMDVD